MVVVGASGAMDNAAILRRHELSGAKSGWAGLVHNKKVFAISVFASLGGLLYGYNQGVFSGVLNMTSFDNRMASAVDDPGTKGWLVAILELGAWFGVLCTGTIADWIGRRQTIVSAVVVFCLGVVVQATALHPSSIYGGRFITGMGVGSLSMAVPLYNAELAPAEVRGSLVALQQLAITFGILVSFWIDFGTNFIGGAGTTQKEAAWRIPLALQLVPALILGIGILFMPRSPRWLVNQGRDDEAQKVLSYVRNLPPEHELIQIEYLEIKAQYLFEKQTSEERFPNLQDGSRKSNAMLAFKGYTSLVTTKSFFVRVAIGSLVMFFQQWTGINAILYYAPFIFQDLGLTGNTISLLATGVVGILLFVATIPAVIWIDDLGRRPVLIVGALGMAACHIIVAILTGLFHATWATHVAAGWAACVFVWIFALNFGYSWGPCAWILISEIFPLSIRGKGMSMAASSNWMNNFIVGQVTPSMLAGIGFGTFIFFGVFSFLGAVFVYFAVPETKGLTLEEMEIVFHDTSGTAEKDIQRQAAINQSIGLTALLHGDTEEQGDIKEKKSDDNLAS